MQDSVSKAFEQLVTPLVEGAKKRGSKLVVALHCVYPNGTRETVAQSAGMDGLEVMASAGLISAVLANEHAQ